MSDVLSLVNTLALRTTLQKRLQEIQNLEELAAIDAEQADLNAQKVELDAREAELNARKKTLEERTADLMRKFLPNNTSSSSSPPSLSGVEPLSFDHPLLIEPTQSAANAVFSSSSSSSSSSTTSSLAPSWKKRHAPSSATQAAKKPKKQSSSQKKPKKQEEKSLLAKAFVLVSKKANIHRLNPIIKELSLEELNAPSAHKKTLLFMAASQGLYQVVESLLDHGADQDIPGHQSRNGEEFAGTPLGVAKWKRTLAKNLGKTTARYDKVIGALNNARKTSTTSPSIEPVPAVATVPNTKEKQDYKILLQHHKNPDLLALFSNCNSPEPDKWEKVKNGLLNLRHDLINEFAEKYHTLLLELIINKAPLEVLRLAINCGADPTALSYIIPQNKKRKEKPFVATPFELAQKLKLDHVTLIFLQEQVDLWNQTQPEKGAGSPEKNREDFLDHANIFYGQALKDKKHGNILRELEAIKEKNNHKPIPLPFINYPMPPFERTLFHAVTIQRGSDDLMQFMLNNEGDPRPIAVDTNGASLSVIGMATLRPDIQTPRIRPEMLEAIKTKEKELNLRDKKKTESSSSSVSPGMMRLYNGSVPSSREETAPEIQQQPSASSDPDLQAVHANMDIIYQGIKKIEYQQTEWEITGRLTDKNKMGISDPSGGKKDTTVDYTEIFPCVEVNSGLEILFWNATERKYVRGLLKRPDPLYGTAKYQITLWKDPFNPFDFDFESMRKNTFYPILLPFPRDRFILIETKKSEKVNGREISYSCYTFKPREGAK